jgi:hypothetical protein
MQAMLGVTVLAWVNSAGDFIADTSMARDGFPSMAVAACFASPFFTLIGGLGLTFMIAVLVHGPVEFEAGIALQVLIILLPLLLVLCASERAAAAPMSTDKRALQLDVRLPFEAAASYRSFPCVATGALCGAAATLPATASCAVPHTCRLFVRFLAPRCASQPQRREPAWGQPQRWGPVGALHSHNAGSQLVHSGVQAAS